MSHYIRRDYSAQDMKDSAFATLSKMCYLQKKLLSFILKQTFQNNHSILDNCDVNLMIWNEPVVVAWRDFTIGREYIYIYIYIIGIIVVLLRFLYLYFPNPAILLKGRLIDLLIYNFVPKIRNAPNQGKKQILVIKITQYMEFIQVN